MRIRDLLVALGAASSTLACSCASYEPVKACQIYHDTPVIFRGRVIDDNHDRAAGFAQMTLYRFRVIEAFKGLPPGTKEVFINPGSMTSCYKQFVSGRDYLVYPGGGGQAPAAVTVLGGRQPNSPAKQLPAAWKGLEQLPVYTVGGCNPTRTVDEKDPDLAFLRSVTPGSKQGNGWIEGRAAQNVNWPYRVDEFVAAAGALVTALSPSGDRVTGSTGPDGAFKLGPIPPGTYAISFHSPVFGTAQAEKPEVVVPPGGCAVARASFETKSTISGKVLNASGKPASHVRVELGELQGDRKIRVIPSTWSDTDQEGRFKIPNAPVGRVVLAANLNGAPTTDMPFDPVYAPGTQDVSSARVFAVHPGEQVTGISLRLPKPLPFAALYVDVKWPDGSSALGGARAFADCGRARAAFENASVGTNRVKLRLALKRTYAIRVDWLDAKPGKFLIVDGAAPQTVEFTHDGQVMELRLKDPPPR